MRGQRETVSAVAELARSAGASCNFEQLRGGHLAAVIGFDGRSGKVILCRSGSRPGTPVSLPILGSCCLRHLLKTLYWFVKFRRTLPSCTLEPVTALRR
jgi:hypothetical protein